METTHAVAIVAALGVFALIAAVAAYVALAVSRRVSAGPLMRTMAPTTAALVALCVAFMGYASLAAWARQQQPSSTPPIPPPSAFHPDPPEPAQD